MTTGVWPLSVMLTSLCIVAAPAPPPRQTWGEKLFGQSAKLTHDFGTVARGTQVHHDFVVTNIYEFPIEISSVRTYGAVSASASRWMLKPNEKANISVRMDASRFAGPKKVSIRVFVRRQNAADPKSVEEEVILMVEAVGR